MNTYICITPFSQPCISDGLIRPEYIKHISIYKRYSGQMMLSNTNNPGWTYCISGNTKDITALVLTSDVRVIQLDIPFHFIDPVILNRILLDNITEACKQLDYGYNDYPLHDLLGEYN